MPKEFPSESIGEEFEEIAEILYRNSMDEVGTHFNPNDIDYDANISGYSIALTDAIHAMMKAADVVMRPLMDKTKVFEETFFDIRSKGF